jgi:3-oxoacyl-[acyl-carrier protein] reductase
VARPVLALPSLRELANVDPGVEVRGIDLLGWRHEHEVDAGLLGERRTVVTGRPRGAEFGAGSGGAGSLDTFDPARMARMRAVNADGVIHTVRAVAPGMRARGYGRIVNVASNAAIGTGLPGTTFYAASKAEVLVLTRRFALELGRSGVTVNAVAPGWVATDMTRSGLSEEAFAERVRTLSERAMVGRPGAPEDIANAVVFLASPESGFVTAQVLTVDGGRMDYIGHG